jgi:peptidoglycan biosynthesis protein MviN/MurJ (putative lipid II flippase)
MSLLFYALRRKLKTLELGAMRKPFAVLLSAAIVAGGVAWGVSRLWGEKFGHEPFALQLGEVFVPIAAASLTYLAIAAAFKTGHVGEMLGILRHRLLR